MMRNGKLRSACQRSKVAQLLNGGVAQLGEHLPCKQGVSGSIPLVSTSPGQQCRPWHVRDISPSVGVMFLENCTEEEK